ncbi:hypothetical protein ABPG73_019548 [Tetrahymena malaccensis]
MTKSPQLYFCLIVVKIPIESSLKKKKRKKIINNNKNELSVESKRTPALLEVIMSDVLIKKYYFQTIRNSGIEIRRYCQNTINGENNKIKKKKKENKKTKKKKYFFTEITFADIEEKTKITTNETEDKTQQGNEITQTIKSNPERENSEFEKNVSQKNTVQSMQFKIFQKEKLCPQKIYFD